MSGVFSRGRVWPMLAVLLAGAALAAPLDARPKASQSQVDARAALQDPTRLVRLGQRLDAKGEAAAAMGFYAQALAIDPRHAPALAAAGLNAMRRGEWEAAAAYFTRRVEATPNDWQARLDLGMSLGAAGRRDEALKAFAEGARLGAPAVVEAGQRGVALDLAGDPRTAQLAYAEALRTAPGDVASTRALSLSMAIAGDYAAALQLLRPLAAQDDPLVRQTTAMIYALSGQTAAATEIKPEPFTGFYARLSRLDTRQKAAAVHLGQVPIQSDGTPQPDQAQASPPAVEILSSPEPMQVAEAPPAGVRVVEGLPPQLRPEKEQSPPAVRVRTGLPPAAEASATPPVEASAKPVSPAPPKPVDPATLARAPRIWVQLGSTPDRRILADEWRRLRRTGAGLIDGYTPVVQQAGANNRLLVGPFDSAGAAQALVKQLGARRMPALVNRTPAGAAIEPLKTP